MPRKSNLDSSIATLMSEIKALCRDQKSAMVQMGHKIIAIKELLRQKYGTMPFVKPDATGQRAPIGWTKWCEENLSISQTWAATCVRAALDPDKVFEQKQKTNKTERSSYKSVLSAVKRIWPKLSAEDRTVFVTEFQKLVGTETSALGAQRLPSRQRSAEIHD